MGNSKLTKSARLFFRGKCDKRITKGGQFTLRGVATSAIRTRLWLVGHIPDVYRNVQFLL
jgi:hypothetical protein